MTGISSKTNDEKPFYSRSYSYDPVGNPTSLTAFTSGKNLIGWAKGESGAWQETYSYEAGDRLTRACMDVACARFSKYSYDGVGNRLSEATEKGTTLSPYNAADQLMSETTDLYNVRTRKCQNRFHPTPLGATMGQPAPPRPTETHRDHTVEIGPKSARKRVFSS